MKALYDFLIDNKEYWDGHFHLFNHKSVNEFNDNRASKIVGFMDLEYDSINLKVVDSYQKFIDNNYNKDKHILLATGTNIEEIKSVFEKHKSIIKGFGELKCYDIYKGKKVPYKKISFVKEVCKFSYENGSLPVYLHWELNDEKDIQKLESLLTSYPTIPIVLCHCGINDYNADFAFFHVSDLCKKYNNLWVDISYRGLEFFKNNPLQLLQLPLNRLIFGTDINNKYTKGIEKYNYNPDEIFNDMDYLINMFNINNTKNIKSLFKI